MRPASMRHRKIFALIILLLVGLPSYAQPAASKKFVFTTKSKEAIKAVEQAVKMIESFQPAPEILPLAQKAVAADPDFAFAHYLVATFTPPPPPGTTPPQPANTPKAHMDKALELSKRASDGERRYLEAVALVRAQKPAEALPLLKQLVHDYPEERMVRMMLGQVLFNRGELDEARTNFERALALDNTTPRVHNLLGNYHLLQGHYAKAREMYQHALKRTLKGTAPFGPNFGLAYTYVYEGNIPEALKILTRFQDQYAQTSGAAEFPPVFIWNAIARLHLENGQPAEAIKFYERGYQTVPGSKLPAEEKMIWQGRLHHGRGRALAKLGKHEEAWKEAQLIKKMIDENPERGKQFMPSYHYIAGYLKLEGGDHATALEHLKQADQSDLFHKLLLARAYDRSGDTANAQKLYREIVESKQNSLERALSVPEAKKKLKG
ncbi:MAG TPA: tetratricopeptide repeat protein [Pyrinomonadaceae bacterium]|nr:tetratricopeptide repeat protein [Pyrinomonadaceae bacterium]